MRLKYLWILVVGLVWSLALWAQGQGGGGAAPALVSSGMMRSFLQRSMKRDVDGADRAGQPILAKPLCLSRSMGLRSR